MEFTTLLETRRSIRAYKADAPVEREQLEEMVKAAQHAPSWKNSQTGRYYIVTSPEKLDVIKKTCLPEFNRKNCENAPALIVTAFVKKRAGFNRDGVAENELGDEWGAYDLGLQNAIMVLKARELGLDTLIMGIRDGEALRQELNIPESQEVVSVISVGYRDIEPSMPKRKEMEQIATFF